MTDREREMAEAIDREERVDRLDLDWVRTQYPTTDDVINAARGILLQANHPDTGMYGTIAALVAELGTAQERIYDLERSVDYWSGLAEGSEP